ncbi:hypothetical protein Ciccas_011438 [Cichlidogyrus casuarinus]|uniref:Uncharacterized protein n=1 Tax=Cichlidogyrus casuarinus TaxID=1844966 RepID=A0ABD2PSF1_9PLAT
MATSAGLTIFWPKLTEKTLSEFSRFWNFRPSAGGSVPADVFFSRRTKAVLEEARLENPLPLLCRRENRLPSPEDGITRHSASTVKNQKRDSSTRRTYISCHP